MFECFNQLLKFANNLFFFFVCFRMYSWLTPRITIWDPEILKQIFIKEYANFPDRQVESGC